MPRKLNIDIDYLINVMQMHDRLNEYYIDLETGKIVCDEELPDDYNLSEDDLLSEDVSIDYESDRYLWIPVFESSKAYRFMEDFIYELENEEARKKLVYAIQGKKPFRRFKDALQAFPDIEKQWYGFEEKRMKEYIVEWLHEYDIAIESS